MKTTHPLVSRIAYYIALSGIAVQTLMHFEPGRLPVRSPALGPALVLSAWLLYVGWNLYRYPDLNWYLWFDGVASELVGESIDKEKLRGPWMDLAGVFILLGPVQFLLGLAVGVPRAVWGIGVLEFVLGAAITVYLVRQRARGNNAET